MILSHKHRFISLKTQKTGGTSVELALRELCGTEDIVAPLPLEDRDSEEALAQNYEFRCRSGADGGGSGWLSASSPIGSARHISSI